MHSVIALSVLASVALAQSTVPTYGSALNMTLPAGSVDPQTVGTWCQGEYNTCSLLCNNNPSVNRCTASNITYQCTCASNNSAPGLQYYQSTMPTYICQYLFQQCITNNVGNQENQKACNTNIGDLCGTVPPPKVALSPSPSATPSSTMATAASGSATGTAGGSSATSTSSHGFAAPTMMPVHGVGAAAIAAIGAVAYLV